MAEAGVVLKLFVQGQSTISSEALNIVSRICELELESAYSLEVIDIQSHPSQAIQAGVIATPTLMRCSPEPVLRTVGRLSEERVRQGLGINE